VVKCSAVRNRSCIALQFCQASSSLRRLGFDLIDFRSYVLRLVGYSSRVVGKGKELLKPFDFFALELLLLVRVDDEA
jgi:hypothetical protein